jgi:hypothetical protein
MANLKKTKMNDLNLAPFCQIKNCYLNLLICYCFYQIHITGGVGSML